MIQGQSIQGVQERLAKEKAAILYISMPGCSVCTAVKPQLTARFDQQVPIIHLDAAAIPEVAGTYEVMTAPAVLVFHYGKEMQRQARFIDYQKIQQLLTDLQEEAQVSYEALFNQDEA